MIPAPLPWAVERIHAGRVHHGGQLPRYGSQEWDLLPPGSAARWASVVIAAEAWRLDALFAAADLELERLGQITEAEIAADREWATQAASIRRMANSPTHLELVRRRSVISGPRDGDYPGRAS